MTAEPLSYRARKRAVQELTTRLSRPTQLDRLAEDDWDVVVVLDACRRDALDAAADWPIGTAVSPGSATDEWLGAVADTDVFADAYVATGNMKYDFFDVGAAETAHLWKTDWDAALGTVLPEPVLDRADEFLAAGDSPVVAHVLPPHAPYVARIGANWLPAYPQTSAWQPTRDKEAAGDDPLSAQEAMASGRIDIDRARDSYEAAVENTWASLLPYLSDWVDREFDVVVTADHGEVFGRLGELKLYGHPNRCHIDPLVNVPYERFSPLAATDGAAESVEQKLQALGYAE